jgi:4-diphosphocytidyl-2-C-methyl-D-erythritol kinase
MRSPMSRISLRAPAKINLFLHILSRQSDGYHRIFSLMQMVGLYDRIDFRKIPARKEIKLQVKGLPVSSGEDNLIVQAARTFLKQYDVPGGVEITLSKRIPVSAGLGGGSSDAAATLRALSLLWGIHPSITELVMLGRSIGSDVPFFFYGPAALVRATGEEILPLKIEGEGWIVMVNIGMQISTAWAYHRLDLLRSNRKHSRPLPHEKFWLTLLKDQNKIASRSKITFQFAKLPSHLHNDLEEVMEAYPVVGAIKDRLRCLGADGVLMSGSGPTVFGLFSKYDSALRVARTLRQEQKDWKVGVAKILKRRPF